MQIDQCSDLLLEVASKLREISSNSDFMKELTSLTFSFISHQDSRFLEMATKLRDVPGLSRTNPMIFPCQNFQ